MVLKQKSFWPHFDPLDFKWLDLFSPLVVPERLRAFALRFKKTPGSLMGLFIVYVLFLLLFFWKERKVLEILILIFKATMCHFCTTSRTKQNWNLFENSHYFRKHSFHWSDTSRQNLQVVATLFLCQATRTNKEIAILLGAVSDVEIPYCTLKYISYTFDTVI